MIDTNTEMELITRLRHKLHNSPEPSGNEIKTKSILMDFIKKNTSMEIILCGQGFYAAHREKNSVKQAVAFRADYDALMCSDGTAKHLCGHDGHAAALCGVALQLEGKTFGRSIFLLFQPAEETGEGAKQCLSIFEKEQLSEMYGAHNLPGYPLGQILTRIDSFACASRGYTLHFTGKAAHAAYPENGISPALAVGKLLCMLPVLSHPDLYSGMILCTVAGAKMGEKAFGVAAAQAEIWLTLRAEYSTDFDSLHNAVIGFAQKLAETEGLEFCFETADDFPSTENDPDCAKKILALPNSVLLPSPMRWSEDFGYYLKHCRGAFFGIGAGETCQPLHTENYEYPDELLEPTIQVFKQLISY